jgi:L-fuconolactonase
MIVDAHHHVWDPARAHYPWLTDASAPIRRAFTFDDLRPALAEAGVDRTILVQTRSSQEETREFLQLAGATDVIAGVVGWTDLTAPDVGEHLDELLTSAQGKWLVGIRHQLHDEADAGWLLRPDVRHGLAEIARRDLVFDLLVRPCELFAALMAVESFPALRFVIDHAAKPDIAGGCFTAWSALLRPFSGHRSHVWCKLSGLVTEADRNDWSPGQLQPYIAEALAIFGPSRCMFGSDWPVCLLAASYLEVIDVVRDAIRELPAVDQALIMGGSAMAAYRLDRSL